MPQFWSSRFGEKSRGGDVKYPVGTIAFYGPDNRHASKVAVGIVYGEGGPETEVERWLEKGLDVRLDPRIGREVVDFLRRKGVRHTVVVGRGIIGCPHEEGIDYPEGAECPQCPWWHGKDRFEEAE